MIRFSPILLALLYGLGMYWFSTMRLRKTLDAQSAELLDPSLQPVLNNMAKALNVDRVKVHLYEVDPVNGLASPDGRIFITRGFYKKYKLGDVSAEEIAAVIAHELGHIALGHSRRRMIDFSSQNAIRAAMGMILGRFLPGIGNWVANILANLLMAKLSRSDEYEADEYASALVSNKAETLLAVPPPFNTTNNSSDGKFFNEIASPIKLLLAPVKVTLIASPVPLVITILSFTIAIVCG